MGDEDFGGGAEGFWRGLQNGGTGKNTKLKLSVELLFVLGWRG